MFQRILLLEMVVVEQHQVLMEHLQQEQVVAAVVLLQDHLRQDLLLELVDQGVEHLVVLEQIRQMEQLTLVVVVEEEALVAVLFQVNVEVRVVQV